MENLTDAQYLEVVLGPQLMGLHVLLPMTVIYSAIFVTGVLGNISVCLVIIRHKSLHTATNYYLFSLAISDLVILVLGLPNELVTYWQQYPWMFGESLCKVRALISEMTSYASVLTIVAFSMERYLAICHPLYQYALSGFSRAVKIITGIWIVSFMAAFPYAYFTQINYIDRPLESQNYLNESAMCALLERNIPQGYPLYQISSVMFFILPLCILLYLYIRMGISLRKTDVPVVESSNSGIHGPRNRYLVLKMLVAVVVVFFLCWAPFHAQRLGVIYLKQNMIFVRLHEYLFYISGFCYYFSATVNPILYNVMSLKYRHAFKATLCGKYQPNGHHRSYTFRSTMRRTTESPIPLTTVSVRNHQSLRGRASTIEEEHVNDTDDVVKGIQNTEINIVQNKSEIQMIETKLTHQINQI